MTYSKDDIILYCLAAIVLTLLSIAIIKPMTEGGRAERAAYDAEPAGAAPIEAEESMGYW